MNDLGTFVAVAAAGGVGSALRYLADNALPPRVRERYPWGTTLVNLTGSFALGLLTGIVTSGSTWHTVAGVGLLGGYTTFSAASLETVQLLAERRWTAATLNGVGTLVGCTLAALAGLAISRG